MVGCVPIFCSFSPRTAKLGSRSVAAGSANVFALATHAYPFSNITDAKRGQPPAAQYAAQPIHFERQIEPGPAAVDHHGKPHAGSDQAAEITAMRDSLKAGIQVVAVPQLFPTPAGLAEEVATEARIEEGMTVCDFSAGTASLLAAVQKVTAGGAICTAVEINAALCDHIRGTGHAVAVHQADFLTLSPNTFGQFERIVLNPPFGQGQDIAHIEHAIGFLKPGGRIVAICANGPRQAQRLGDLAKKMGGTFRALPEGAFLSSGTNVRAAPFVANINQEEHAEN